MEKHCCRTLFALAVCVTLAFFMSTPALAMIYTITDLETLGDSYSYAYGINNLGQVTGYSAAPNPDPQYGYMPDDAFLWTKEDGMINLSMGAMGDSVPYALGYAINDHGIVVGTQSNQQQHPKLNPASWPYGYAGGNPNTWEDAGEALDINNHNVTVGYSWCGNPWYDNHAYVSGPGFSIDLGVNSPEGVGSVATAINDNGQVVGDIEGSGGFLWSDNNNNNQLDDGEMEIIGGYPIDINDLGVVLGYDALWTEADGWVDENFMGALAINNKNQVVGRNAGHAFLRTENDGMVDLNDLILSGSGWELLSATDINMAGQIAGYGVINGQTHAFLATPVPEPATVLLLGTGLVGLVAFRKKLKK